MVGAVIQATKTMKSEDGLRMRVLRGLYWCHCGACTKPRINDNPLFGCGLSYGPLSDQISACLVSSKEMGMFVLFPGFYVTMNVSPGGEQKSLMMGYPYSFIWKVSIQTNNNFIITCHLQRCSAHIIIEKHQ